MRTFPALCSVMFATCACLPAAEGRPMEVSREFSSAERKDADALQAIATRDRVVWNRRTALAWYFTCEPDTAVERIVKTTNACSALEGGITDLALVLAVSARAGAILPLLARVPSTQRAAAETIATRAVMRHLAQRRNTQAAQVKIRPAEGLPNPKLGAAKPVPGGNDAELIKALLASKDRTTAERALIAAAYTGGADLLPDAEASTARGEVADACRLLLRARHGQPIPAELATSVMAAKPRPQYTTPLPALSSGDLDVPAQCILLDAIIASRDQANTGMVERMLAHPDLRIRQDACRAARVLAAPTSVQPLITALQGAEWPVLVEAAAALGELAPVEAVAPLIAELRRQKGRFRQDLIHALASIAGGQESRSTAEAWSAWWEPRKAAFVPDREATRLYRANVRVQNVDMAGFAAFYDMPIRSDRFAFILDASGSMKADGKIDDLRSNASQAVRMLPPQILFNVVDFGGHISRLGAYEDIGVERQAALRRIADFTLSMGGTRSIDAIAAGLALRDVDTLYFLSDGDPHGSQCDDWERSCAMAAMLTRHRPVALGMISFHAGPGNAQGMWRMAVEHAGRFQAF